MKIQNFTMIKCSKYFQTNICNKENERIVSCGIAQSHRLLIIPFVAPDTNKGVTIPLVSSGRWLSVLFWDTPSVHAAENPVQFSRAIQRELLISGQCKTYQGLDGVSTFTTKSSLLSRQRKCLSHLSLREWQPYKMEKNKRNISGHSLG